MERFIEANEVVDRSTELVSLQLLEEYRDEYIRKYTQELIGIGPLKAIRDEMIKEFSFGCRVRIKDSKKVIEMYKMNLLAIMYKNLLDNYRKWGDIERDSVLIFQKKNTNVIDFIVNSSSRFDDDKMKKLLIEPYMTTANQENKAHYGMFIIGMIARHLGGYAYVLNKKDKGRSRIIIKIPVN